MERTERAGKRAFARAVRPGEAIGFKPLYGRDPEHAFGAYLRRMIDDDRDLRESTREPYLRNIRVHIEGTPLARIDVRDVSPDDLSDFWRSLDIGVGAKRNV